MNEKKMELERFKKTKAKIKRFYAIWNGIMIFPVLTEIHNLGIQELLMVVTILAFWNYYPTVMILYVTKVRQIYPGIGALRSVWLTNRILHGKEAKEFKKLWRRCFLIIPVLKEFAEEERILELQASATDISERPRYVDL